MIPLPPWAMKLAAEFAVCLALFGIGYWRGHESEAEKFAQFRAEVETQGQAAQAAAAQENIHHEQVRQQVAAEYEAQIQPAQDEAVRRYRASHPVSMPVCSGGGAVPVASASPESTDAAGPGLVAGSAGPDDATIRDCAADALTVGAWQSWARLNSLPVE